MREGGKEPVPALLTEVRIQRDPVPQQRFQVVRHRAGERAAHLIEPWISFGHVQSPEASGYTPSIYTCTLLACHNASDKTMENKKSVQQMNQRYARLTAQIAKLGTVLQGTITERSVERKDPHHPGKTKTYGPYYQWTFKRQGKTVTVNLTRTQAKTYQRAINNHRKLEKTTQEMRELSLKILEATTRAVKRRKSTK